jgi:nitrile hydratase
MNGIHDMGGMHGFGAIPVEADEPVFHARWEARVFGMVQGLPGRNIDAGRHSIERLDPVAYLANGYYGRWFAALERGLAGAGVLSPGELEARMSAGAPRAARPATGPLEPWRPARRNYLRAVERAPAFAPGQRVRTRNHQPAGHTRLPGYARGRRGVVVRRHGAMVYPDDHAHDRGENPQHLYGVRFEARELWGEGAEPGVSVCIDLFEPYLERDGS